MVWYSDSFGGLFDSPTDTCQPASIVPASGFWWDVTACRKDKARARKMVSCHERTSGLLEKQGKKYHGVAAMHSPANLQPPWVTKSGATNFTKSRALLLYKLNRRSSDFGHYIG